MTAVNIAFGIVIAAVIFAAIHSGLLPTRDSTDGPYGSRSGLQIFTDKATGVQYVGAPFYGLAARLDRNGLPYRDRPTEGSGQ